MITAVIQHKKDTLVVELPRANTDLQIKLLSIGVMDTASRTSSCSAVRMRRSTCSSHQAAESVSTCADCSIPRTASAT